MKSKKKPSPWILRGSLLLALAYVMGGFHVPSHPTGFDFKSFGQLPVLSGGRLKPIDTLARSSLLVLSGKQTVRFDGKRQSALQWLMEMMARPIVADEWPVIRIDDPDVLGLMGIQQTGKRVFSFSEIHPFLGVLEQQAQMASQVAQEERNRFQGAVLTLSNQLMLYQKLQNTVDRSGLENSYKRVTGEIVEATNLMKDHEKVMAGGRSSPDVKKLSDFLNTYTMVDQFAEFYPFPSHLRRKSDHDWISAGQAVLQSVTDAGLHPGLGSYLTLLDAVRADDALLFNKAVRDYQSYLSGAVPSVLPRASAEFFFNWSEPFYKSLVIYVVAFLLVLMFWLSGKTIYQEVSFGLIVLAFLVHTGGLLARMILHGRPPVTNLYSSAIFVGWASVLLGLILEKLSKKGFGALVSSLIGFSTLIIAHNLASQGDTLEMMRAVLDSNFWLATHVVTITIGYASTFLSGALGIVYVLRRWLDRSWTPETSASIEKMAYGVVCFNLFFSFIGTILGGIWADQSWGRFWGWDPKENGALMIVLWNAFILHVRWGRMASERGLMVMSIFGNIITALSWFGVNMLGIGLHSYGFMDKAFFWLMLFVVSQAVIMGVGYLPPRPVKKIHSKQ